MWEQQVSGKNLPFSQFYCKLKTSLKYSSKRKQKQRIFKNWDNYKKCNIRVIGIKGNKITESIFETIMIEHFSQQYQTLSIFDKIECFVNDSES